MVQVASLGSKERVARHFDLLWERFIVCMTEQSTEWMKTTEINSNKIIKEISFWEISYYNDIKISAKKPWDQSLLSIRWLIQTCIIRILYTLSITCLGENKK